MKKILLFLVAFLCISTSFSQDLKKFRFGLKIVPSFDWYNVDNAKKYESGGVRAKFGWGFACEYNISHNASIVSGLEINYTGGIIKLLDTASYFYNSVSDEIILVDKDGQIKDLNDTVGMVENLLVSRTFNGSYVTLPLAIKMKTNEIGYFSYYGIFGLSTSINTRGRANDDIVGINNLNSSLEKLHINKEMQPIIIALNIGLGLEYNFSGTTSLFTGVRYNNGFSNVTKKTSTHLIDESGKAATQRFLARGITIHIGFLF